MATRFAECEFSFDVAAVYQGERDQWRCEDVTQRLRDVSISS